MENRIRNPTVELEMLRPLYPKLRRPVDPDTFEQYKQNLIVEPADIASSELLSISLASGGLAATIGEMQWGTFDLSNRAHSLLTSDRPVVMKQGLATPNAYVAIPLSPHMLFYATRTDVSGRIPRKAAEKIVVDANDAVTRQAVKYVYGRDESQLRFVQNRFATKSGLNGMEPIFERS
jgi:hypothetical protein